MNANMLWDLQPILAEEENPFDEFLMLFLTPGFLSDATTFFILFYFVLYVPAMTRWLLWNLELQQGCFRYLKLLQHLQIWVLIILSPRNLLFVNDALKNYWSTAFSMSQHLLDQVNSKVFHLHAKFIRVKRLIAVLCAWLVYRLK